MSRADELYERATRRLFGEAARWRDLDDAGRAAVAEEVDAVLTEADEVLTPEDFFDE